MLGKIKPQVKFMGITCLLVILGAVTSLLTPILIQYLNQHEVGLSYGLVFLVFCSMLFSFLLQIALNLFRENYAASFNVNNMMNLIRKLMALDYDSFVQKEPSYLVQRIFTAVDNFYFFSIMSLTSIVKNFFIIILSLVLVGMISWKMFFILACLLPLNYFGFRSINHQLSIKMKKMQENSAVATKDVMTVFSNVEVVKTVKDPESLINMIEGPMKEMYQMLAQTNKYAQVTSGLITFINQLVQNMMYFWTSLMILENIMPVGNLIIISIVIPMYYSALSELSQVNIDYKSLEVSKELIKNDLDNQKEKSGNQQIERIQNIDFNKPSFRLKDQIFRFSIKESLKVGDVVYLEGESGSGKTSFLRLLLKFRESKGIMINGEQIEGLDTQSLRNRISYCSQNTLILSTTLENNISMGKVLSQEKKNWLESTGILTPILDTKTWETCLYENGANLSGGERQRIAICRLLLEDNDVIILDESISNLDQESAHIILSYLTKYSKNKMIIYTAHDKEFRKYSNKQIYLGREC